ncbi:MAG: APC family permease [Spirochaetaceae bacterium]|jgi:amino acid transporter|nr:APC family permease [Spirochaetaceae bacterium]
MNGTEQGGTLGLGACVGILIGGMVGSAIFSLSGVTVFTAGPAAILSWALAALIMLSYGLITAELATRFPKSGGVFVFPARAIGGAWAGRVWGWISTWAFINANIAAIAFSAIYVATYLGVGFPAFAGLQRPLALGTIGFCFILNCVKFSTAGRVNSALVVLLGGTLTVFIVTAFASGAWDPSLLTPFFGQGAGGRAGFVEAIPVAMVAYGTIVGVAFIVSEVKDPRKNVPASMFIALALVMTLYLLVITATVGLVPASFLAENPGMRYIPLYAACFTKLAAFPWLARVVSVSAVLALLTTALVVTALTTRAMQSVSEAGLLPRWLSVTGPSGSPVPAAALTASVSALVACFPQFTSMIVNYGALFATITIAVNCVSLLYARKREPSREGSFRAPLGRALPVVTMAVLGVCYAPGVRSGGIRLWAYTLGSYCVGFALFAFQTRRRKRG